MRSIEEKVEEHFKKILDDYKIRHYGKNWGNQSYNYKSFKR